MIDTNSDFVDDPNFSLKISSKSPFDFLGDDFFGVFGSSSSSVSSSSIITIFFFFDTFFRVFFLGDSPFSTSSITFLISSGILVPLRCFFNRLHKSTLVPFVSKPYSSENAISSSFK